MMSETDTNGLRLLSLDGGGIRGLSTLLILENIMYRIKTKENLQDIPHPCDYFDLIGGTSTGGIIAIMLGRLRMSVEDAIKCYDDLAGKVFSKLKRGGDGKYSATLLEEVIKGIVQERTGNSETQLLDDGQLVGVCKTFVCAMNAHNMNARIPFLFRTYESSNEVSIPCTIWQAARATSATPTIFKRVFIGPVSRPEPFIDGGVGQNNPIAQALAEAEFMFPNMNIACVISIGTGKPETINAPKPSFFERNVVPVGIIRAMVAMAIDCEYIAQQMEKKFEHWSNTYFRFNVEQGLQRVKLGDWDRMGEVSAHTWSYMSMQEVDRRLDTAVNAIRERKGGIKTLAISTEQDLLCQLYYLMLNMFNMDRIPNQDMTVHGPANIDISPSYVPEKPLYIFGRDKEREDIVKALLKSESVIIPGSGGMGKTTLALAVLHDERVIGSEHFESRIYFIDCSTITALEGLYGQLAVDLLIPKAKRDGHLQETLLHTFRNMAWTVLCLDNFETLWDVDEARANIETMLSRFHGIRTLALLLTMRGMHRPANVRWSEVSPRRLERLSNDASTDIFREQSLSQDVDEYAKRLIDAADGMPLTITLLARLAQIETPKATWTRWTTTGTSIANQGTGRTMNLDTSIELSLNGPRLKGDMSAVQTLGILAHLPDGLEHPSDISDGLQSSLRDNVDLPAALSKLVTVGLAYVDTARNSRYRVLSPISTYAMERKLMGESSRASLIDYYTTFILDKTVSAARRNSTLRTIVPHELANIRNILEVGIKQYTISKTFDERQIHALLTHMDWELELGRPSPDAMQKVISPLPLRPGLRGDCYLAVGEAHRYQDRLAEAEQSLNQALELYQQAQDVLGEGNTRDSLGDLYLRQDRLAEAEQSLNQALELYQQAQNVLGEGNTRKTLGDLYRRQDRLAEAEQSLNQALKLYQQAQHVLGEAYVRRRLQELFS